MSFLQLWKEQVKTALQHQFTNILCSLYYLFTIFVTETKRSSKVMSIYWLVQSTRSAMVSILKTARKFKECTFIKWSGSSPLSCDAEHFITNSSNAKNSENCNCFNLLLSNQLQGIIAKFKYYNFTDRSMKSVPRLFKCGAHTYIHTHTMKQQPYHTILKCQRLGFATVSSPPCLCSNPGYRILIFAMLLLLCFVILFNKIMLPISSVF